MKLNSEVYNKIILQAEEARDQGLESLADNVLSVIGPMPEEEMVEYSSDQLDNDLNREMWRLATYILKYHNVKSVDIQKMDECLKLAARSFKSLACAAIDKDYHDLGPLEPKVPGQL